MIRVVILTGNDLRHAYVRKALAVCEGIDVVRSYCEGKKKLGESAHLRARDVSEADFFGAFVKLTPDRSNPVFIESDEINQERHVRDIISLSPDVIVAYGCSIVRGELLEAFAGRFINVHLGLSPYYRGAGTNFWPLVNGEPEFVGVTYMHIDAGIDTGEIIHQERAVVRPDDMPHQIGNRLIARVPFTLAELIRHIGNLQKIAQPELHRPAKVYRRRDFSEEATQKLYRNFKDGMVADYLKEYENRIRNAPIVTNPIIGSGDA